ncbi:MAG TPA: M12 family metallopeptidase, partial [Chitinophagaceae bacterium]|nr:M12 family metallopeptidase [Chitinophagaceae bacterium]
LLTLINPMMFVTIACSVSNAQELSGYLVQPTTKVYTKFRNPLIKKDGKPVTVLVLNGKAYLDGDILLGSVADLDAYQNSFQAQSVTNDDNLVLGARWVEGIVPFEILPGFTDGEKQTIINALNYISANTHVCFRHRINGESNYVKFKRVTKEQLGYEGGHSELGRCAFCPDGQEIQLTPGVTNRTVLHEVCHALGLLHEQSREDRDTYVEILFDNIEFPLGLGGNFGKAIFTSTDVGKYDFNSIMHYRYNAFGKVVNKEKLQTIRRRSDPADQSFGKSNVLSSGDIAGINSMYPVEKSCAAVTVLVPGELAVGESKTINISASKVHDLTGIYMRLGQSFQFTTTSRAWNNGTRETDCNGYAGSVLDRHGDINEMALTGEIFNQNNTTSYSGTYFKIGCGRTWTSTKTGFLVCFANDIITAYGDNSRIVELTVKRTQ